jgi:hypothetical protein
LVERVDGAQLRAARDYLPYVAGVITSYVFRDRSWYNEENDRAHVRMLHEAGIECTRPLYQPERPQPQLCDADLAKLRVGYSGFGCHDILKPCVNAEIDFDAERPIDVFFAGTVDYEGTEVDTHRRLALQAAETWPGKSVASAGRGIPRKRYYDLMRQSKVVLCPWGWGEATYREYEAMALGAVVLKPDSSHVESWPELYTPYYCGPCSAGFSDAHDAIRYIVGHWDQYRELRSRARLVVCDHWQPGAIARRMAHLIKELAG